MSINDPLTNCEDESDSGPILTTNGESAMYRLE